MMYYELIHRLRLLDGIVRLLEHSRRSGVIVIDRVEASKNQNKITTYCCKHFLNVSTSVHDIRLWRKLLSQ